jgi:hypothetical protein
VGALVRLVEMLARGGHAVRGREAVAQPERDVGADDHLVHGAERPSVGEGAPTAVGHEVG